MLVLGTNILDLFDVLFHGLQASMEYQVHGTIHRINQVLIITITPSICSI